MESRVRPRTVSWVSPDQTELQERKHHLKNGLHMIIQKMKNFNFCILATSNINKCLCGTVSKTLAKSVNIKSVCIPQSQQWDGSCIMWSVNCHINRNDDQNPYCCSLKILLTTRCFMMFELIICSKSLETIEVRETGQ